MRTTLSVIKADIGGWVGHSSSHPEILQMARNILQEEKNKGFIKDFYVTACGDDLQLIMTHQHGNDNSDIHGMAWNVFKTCTEKAKELKLYGAGQDLLKDTFSGNLHGMGPGVAELEFEERPSEPVIIFMADKTEPGAWNIPLYKMFADPFNTVGLVIDPELHAGFTFEVHDVIENKKIELKCPDEIYDLLAFIGQPGRYVIKHVYRNDDKLYASSTSTSRLSLIAGRYVGKDDPVMIVRAQHGLPAVGEILEAFAQPWLVAGWMRGSHHGPLMPVAVEDATPTRFDGPPRVMALGFQLADGMLGIPRDMLADKSFDRTREKANELADFMRANGPFEPHRLDSEAMEYTTLPSIKKKLKKRFKDI
ncbi:MAG: fructose-1,6-bisphosphate aldolase/phosphatase [Candidatus Aenigmatarchaeota archaeon]